MLQQVAMKFMVALSAWLSIFSMSQTAATAEMVANPAAPAAIYTGPNGTSPGVDASAVSSQSATNSNATGIVSAAGAVVAPNPVVAAGPTLLATGAIIGLSQLKAVKELRVHLPSFRARFSGLPAKQAQKQGSLLQAGVLQGGVGCLLRSQSVSLPSGGASIDLEPQTNEKSVTPQECIFEIQANLDENVDLQIFADRDAYVEIENWRGDVQYKTTRGIIGFSRLQILDVECVACDISGESLEGPLYFQIQQGTVGILGMRDSVTGSSGGDVSLQWENIKKESIVNLSSKAGDIRLDFPRQAQLTMDLKAPRAEIFSVAPSSEGGVIINATAQAGSVRVTKH